MYGSRTRGAASQSDGWQTPSIKDRLGALLRPLIIDLVIPYGIFFALTEAGVNAIVALAVGGAVPAIRVLVAWRRRAKIDPIAVFIVALFVLGIVLSAISGNPKFALAKEGIFTGLVGVWCIVSLFRGRPLMFYVQREIWPVGEEQWDVMWRGSRPIRRNLYTSTALWGVGLVAEAIAVIGVVYQNSVESGAALSLALNVAVIATLVTLTHLFGYRFKKHASKAPDGDGDTGRKQTEDRECRHG